MPKFRRIKKFGKTFLDIPAWMGWPRLKSSGQAIGTTAKRLFIPQKADIKEEFHEAVARLQLSENDLQEKQRTFLKLCIIFVFMGFALLSYAIYLAWQAYVNSAFVTLSLTLLLFAIAFRYHFWYFQVKQRRLGCTLKDWYYANIANSRPPSPPQAPAQQAPQND